MRCWHVLHTQPRKEWLVRDLLLGRDLQVYLPMLVPASKPRSRRPHEEPLFARYLFVRFDPTVTSRSSIHWTQGVTRLVSFGGEPAVVPDPVIAWLQDRLAPTADGQPGWGQFQPGEHLRITDGPLAGLDAVFDRRLSSENRARVFIDILGRLSACEVDVDCLERV